MSELRYNVVTQEWVIIAPERAKRPMAFASTLPMGRLPEHDPECPFCPGNEAMASEETFRMVDARGAWLTRAVKNKYPALDEDVDPIESGDFFRTSIRGFGIHEVIIDTPRHDSCITMLSIPQLTRVLLTYRHRYLAHADDKRVKHIILFKNNGMLAGSSLVHPHSQLIASPIISHQISARLHGMQQYFEETGHCLMCDMLQRELEENQRIIYQNDKFVSFLPYAALSSYHTWIFPRRHDAHFGALSDDDLASLAEILSLILQAHEKLLGRPDFNFVVRSAPMGCPNHLYHWYVSIIPRISKTAGFEIGSNIFINTSLPEHNALELRHVVDILRGK
ncbi:MAG: galactose-1-phosphate uridylyltransferase [Proteobacteria bacterium]|nr:galactose-1-phosphate uridylyltransferase [Pseudomonadota bacterium]